jgi:hypothetical protein
MEEFKELDDLFKNGLENARITPPAGAWEGIASSVSAATTAAGQTSVWLVAAKWFAGALVAAGVTYMAVVALSDNSGPKESAGSTAAANTANSPAAPATTDISGETAAVTDLEADKRPGSGEEKVQFTLPPVVSEQDLSEDRFTAPVQDGLSPMLVTKDSREPTQNKWSQTASRAGTATSADALKECKHTVSIAHQRISGSAFAFQAQNAGGLVTWYFGDGTVESGNVTSHEYGSIPAVYFVKVVTQSPLGCRDSALEKVVITGKRPSIMNVFTPNSDGINDEYYVDANNTVYYDLVIRDMQDREVFRSSDPEKKWNGKCKYIDCPEGKYQVTFAYKYPGDESPVVIREILILTRDRIDRN